MFLPHTSNYLIPYISNIPNKKNLDTFFYEYATYNKIDISSFDISQQELNLEINMIYHKFFKKELLDTIFIVDRKEYLVELQTYNLKNYNIKVPESVFNLFQSSEYITGKITLEFDKIRGFFYISNFEKWAFNFSINDYFKTNISFSNLLSSFGYNSNNLLFREKISIIARLLPCVEKNINIIEITKPQVGKSYIYDEIITHNSIVKKLGDLTQTNLFSSIKSNDQSEAILKNYPILCIDEFHKGDFKDLAAGLQTYMENGKVSRGKKSYHSDTSITMFANFKESNMYKKIFINPDKFNPFNDINGVDTAFLERINYINPSFGMRTLNEQMFLDNNIPRIPVSLYQEILNSLRNIDIDFKKIFPNIKIYNNNTELDFRKCNSIFKVASGFLKLLFPKAVNAIRTSSCGLNERDYINICFYLAMEGISVLSTLRNESTNFSVNFGDYILELNNFENYKALISYFTGINSNNISNVSAHRITLLNTNQIISRYPLDTFGLDENIIELNNYSTYFQNIITPIQPSNEFCIHLPNYQDSIFFQNNLGIHVKQPNQFNLIVAPFYNGIMFKDFSKNYLFGYKLFIPPQNTTGNIQLSTSFLGLNHISIDKLSFICNHCNYDIFSSPVIYLTDHIHCPNCKNKFYNYEIFPQYFKDYKG